MGMPQRPMFSPFVFTFVVDVTEFARDGVQIEILYADDLLLICEAI